MFTSTRCRILFTPLSYSCSASIPDSGIRYRGALSHIVVSYSRSGVAIFINGAALDTGNCHRTFHISYTRNFARLVLGATTPCFPTCPYQWHVSVKNEHCDNGVTAQVACVLIWNKTTSLGSARERYSGGPCGTDVVTMLDWLGAHQQSLMGASPLASPTHICPHKRSEQSLIEIAVHGPDEFRALFRPPNFTFYGCTMGAAVRYVQLNMWDTQLLLGSRYILWMLSAFSRPPGYKPPGQKWLGVRDVYNCMGCI